MANSRDNSQDQGVNGGAVGPSKSTSTTPWPLLETATVFEPTPASNPAFTVGTEHPTAQQALENLIRDAEARPGAAPRRPSRLRLFTSGFPRLRRIGTGDTSASTGGTSDTTSPTNTIPEETHTEVEAGLDATDPSDEAVEAYMRKHARNGTKFGSVMKLMTRRLPPPTEDYHPTSDGHALTETSMLPTTLQAAIRVFPETKILTDDFQEFSVAVDIEGVLYNSMPLPDTTIDVIFVVDNGYYVTKECLHKALDAVNGALYHLDHGDRLALYTTHCTHHPVTGNRPDMHYPIRPFGTDSEEIFQDLTTRIARFGTQVWQPPRPNPAMADVILGIARSLADQDLKIGRTHIILLSPAAYVLHGISKFFPDLYIHRVNPAALPYRRDLEPPDTICLDACCKNVFTSNWASYQSVPGRIKRIVKNARTEKPIGELTNMSIDIRTKPGCRIIESWGSKNVPVLRLGQVHTMFLQLRIIRNETKGINLKSDDPVFNSSVDAQGLRQEIHNAIAIGAIKVHLFDVQVLHRNSIHPADCWSYTETPLLSIRQLGGLAPPLDTAMEVYKRRYFHDFSHLTTTEAAYEAKDFLAKMEGTNGQAKKVIERLSKEIGCHQAIQEYEHKCRQKLPLCPGPVTVEASPHEWRMDLWDKKKSKRKAVAVVDEEEIHGLIDGMHGLKRLG